MERNYKLLQRKLKKAEKVKKEFVQLNVNLHKIFTKGQIRKVKNLNARIKWSVEDISSAVSLFAAGPRAYRHLYRKNHPLPAPSTLRKWASKIKVEPGVIDTALNLMAHYELEEIDKVCVLVFDEMKIKSTFEYDKACDATMSPSNYVQVVIVRGLRKQWKQPIYFNYDQNMTATILRDILQKLHVIGYNVVAITSDMGPANQGLWRELNVSCNKVWFPHPSDGLKKVFVFADPVHLIKLLRNHFLDSGYHLGDVSINATPVKEVLSLISVADLKIAFKLTDEHLSVEAAARQKVKFATQLFSNSVSSAIRRCVMLGKCKNKYALQCADFIKIVNDWFDVFNSKVPEIDSRNRIKAFGLAVEEQNDIINKMNDNILQLRASGKKVLLPFQKGILLSNKSLVGLYDYLKDNYNFRYILTDRLNQDIIEHFFSSIRSKGGLHDHPTAVEFKYRLRSYLLGI